MLEHPVSYAILWALIVCHDYRSCITSFRPRITAVAIVGARIGKAQGAREPIATNYCFTVNKHGQIFGWIRAPPPSGVTDNMWSSVL